MLKLHMRRTDEGFGFQSSLDRSQFHWEKLKVGCLKRIVSGIHFVDVGPQTNMYYINLDTLYSLAFKSIFCIMTDYKHGTIINNDKHGTIINQ